MPAPVVMTGFLFGQVRKNVKRGVQSDDAGSAVENVIEVELHQVTPFYALGSWINKVLCNASCDRFPDCEAWTCNFHCRCQPGYL